MLRTEREPYAIRAAPAGRRQDRPAGRGGEHRHRDRQHPDPGLERIEPQNQLEVQRHDEEDPEQAAHAGDHEDLQGVGFILGPSIAGYMMAGAVMGWLVLIAVKPLLQAMPAAGVAWLVAGGLCYTGGIWFYRHKEMPYSHMIWHLFVIAGTVCHFIAIIAYSF